MSLPAVRDSVEIGPLILVGFILQEPDSLGFKDRIFSFSFEEFLKYTLRVKFKEYIFEVID